MTGARPPVLGMCRRGTTGVDRRGRQGQSRTGHATQTNRLWRRAESVWDQAEAAETAWKQVQSAFEFFTPEGHLNDRDQAEAVVAAALLHLTGPAWAQTLRILGRSESLTFLDQTHWRLAALGMDPEVLAALLDLEGLPPILAPVGNGAGVGGDTGLGRGPHGPVGEDAIPTGVSGPAGPPGAARGVACEQPGGMRQQRGADAARPRHRKMTQGLLDLKRLDWNLRHFRTGRRKDRTPYDLLGLKLPDFTSLGVPQADPGGIAATTVRNGSCAGR